MSKRSWRAIFYRRCSAGFKPEPALCLHLYPTDLRRQRWNRGGERGQKHSGITASRVGPKYGPERSGETATGWTCKSEGPAPEVFVYLWARSLRWQRRNPRRERGQVHSGVSLLRLQSGYGPERQGDAATGWTCTQETAQSVCDSPSAQSDCRVRRRSRSWLCLPLRRRTWLGAGGAPLAKGEVRNNVPASLINDRYQSDKPGGWVCSVAAGTVPHDPRASRPWVSVDAKDCSGAVPVGLLWQKE